LPSDCSHAKRFVGAGFEEFAGESAEVSASGFEFFMLFLSFASAVLPYIVIRLCRPISGLSPPQCAAILATCGNELSSLAAPFQNICTPMHTSRNEDNLRITFTPVGPRALARRSAKA
jgi:hypothetical protein